jgi:hypothetical protein
MMSAVDPNRTWRERAGGFSFRPGAGRYFGTRLDYQALHKWAWKASSTGGFVTLAV